MKVSLYVFFKNKINKKTIKIKLMFKLLLLYEIMDL